MLIAGLDPGLAGAVFIMDSGRSFGRAYDMPIHALKRGKTVKREIDVAGLVLLLSEHRIGHAFLEQSWARPGEASSVAFSFGKGYGIALGALGALGIPYTLVPPQRWKKALGVPAEKDGARARASQLFPWLSDQWPLKKHDGRAEAALLCHYGILSFEKIGEAA